MKTIVLVVALSLVSGAGLVHGQCGVAGIVSIEYPQFENLSIYVLPDGSGPPLTEAFDGEVIRDGSIRFWLGDEICSPVANFPREDLWISPGGDHWDGCSNVSYYGGIANPDDNTDVWGFAQYSQPLRGGGWSEGPFVLYINGEEFGLCDYADGYNPVPMRFNSPDINADLQVGVADVALFAQDYYGGYHYRSDFRADGVLTLADVAILAESLGANCD